MLKRWITIESVVDNYLDEIDYEHEGETKWDSLLRISKRHANRLFAKTNSTLYNRNIKGVIKSNMFETPIDFVKPNAIWVENNRVEHTNQNFLNSNISKSTQSIYKGRFIGDSFQFNVVGGQNLDGKEYQLDYDAAPIVNGQLFIPEQFEEAIIANLNYISIKRKIEKNGRGEGLLRSYYQIMKESEQEAIVDVDFPSWDEMLKIGKIWESKVVANIHRANNRNNTEF